MPLPPAHARRVAARTPSGVAGVRCGSASAIAALAALVALAPAVAVAQPPADPRCDAHAPTWALASGACLTLFPPGEVFPTYVADPHRPTNALLFRFYPQTQIPGTTARRTGLSGGGRFGLLRVDGAGDAPRSWQISMDAGLDALFDSEYSDDAIGWDGNYGLTLTTAAAGPWALKLAVLHTSAHLGDEYEERMHRARIDYTREEVAVGVSWLPAARWRVYGESGAAFQMKMAEQERWRAQAGLEFESSPIWGRRFAWYAAIDTSALQERSWRLDPALQSGLVTRSHGRAYRMLIEFYNGRPTATEFFKSTETSITIGLRFDL